MIAEIPIGRKRTLVLDVEDLDKVLEYSWHVNNGYAMARVDGRRVYLHRLLLNAGVEQKIDHANGDRLDNRRANLRFCSSSENAQNRGAPSNNRSGFKGVSYNAAQASKAYAAKAKELHGVFARTVDEED